MTELIFLALSVLLFIAGFLLRLQKISRYLALKYIPPHKVVYEKATSGDDLHQKALDTIKVMGCLLILFGSWGLLVFGTITFLLKRFFFLLTV